MKTHISDWLHDLFDFLFPRYCVLCKEKLLRHETHLCLSCLSQLPYTQHYRRPVASIEEELFKRVSYKRAVSLLYFQKGNMTQQLLHILKYQNEPECARFAGKLLAEQLMLNDPMFQTVDYIIPIPLHPHKYKQRGYNQSEMIAEGIASVIHKEVRNNLLLKIKDTRTQTHHTAEIRRKNVEESFRLGDPDALISKHILLVDDVLTTGATIEAAAKCLFQVENLTLSVATLSVVERE